MRETSEKRKTKEIKSNKRSHDRTNSWRFFHLEDLTVRQPHCTHWLVHKKIKEKKKKKKTEN